MMEMACNLRINHYFAKKSNDFSFDSSIEEAHTVVSMKNWVYKANISKDDY
jgi:hypothetical protein